MVEPAPLPAESIPGWVFDVGANNGDDSAFYLAKGFPVLAVEADPRLAEALRQRFAAELASGQFRLEACGLAAGEGAMPFYLNLDWSEWSSFVRQGKATQGRHEVLTVPTLGLARLVERHGCPYYLKLDIEGFEKPVLSGLSGLARQPPYLSWELCADWRDCLATLQAAGYTGFQLVRQGEGHLPAPPQPAREGRYAPARFSNQMSGCFGRELTGAWQDAGTIMAAIEAELAARAVRKARGEKPGWHDVHCRHRNAVPTSSP
ncbi:MAG TPA: FkbM family methyltransferase [Nevskiaceae bacterium]|nr:FkbM family methyltransferase [Nevskiaceae bacterium]